jgi:hypothetical protein
MNWFLFFCFGSLFGVLAVLVAIEIIDRSNRKETKNDVSDKTD